MKYTCRDCRFFDNDPAWLEKVFPGLNALSSAYGSTRGENGVCSKRDLYLSPIKGCRDFEHRYADTFITSLPSIHDKSSA